jgi:translation initiation factor IF-3
VNHKIRAPRVRCIDAAGNMAGVLDLHAALELAQQQGLDLVEISPNADPPVCRLMDYGKYKYELGRKERLARKHHRAVDLKEIKFHANVADHDYQTTVNHIREFLRRGHKVKASLYFRGRENAHREIGFEVIARMLKACEDVSVVDMPPKLIGNSILTIIGPRSGKGHAAAPAAPRPAPAAPAEAPQPAPVMATAEVVAGAIAGAAP